MVPKNLIIVGYARSGLTILNRCLASDSRLICLSEINTRYICPTQPNLPHQQLKEWYGIGIESGSIMSELEQTIKYSNNGRKPLIVRDWSFGSFVPLKYNNLQPSMTLNTIDDLNKTFPGQFKVVCMVRNPIDVWLSMRYSEKNFYDKELVFLMNFVSDVLKRQIPIIKYEDFCLDPKMVLREIYRTVDLEIPNSIRLSNNVIGDINYPKSSRGATLNQIISLPRRTVSADDSSFLNEHTCAKKIADLLGYSIQ